MTLAVEANGLDVAAIHPSKGAKYSPNLHAWLTLRTKKHRAETSRVFSDQKGTLYIGFIDDGYLIGSRLIAVLCNGKKEESWAFGYLGELTEIPDFWARYTAVGRCAIDPEHKMLVDDRWRTNGEHRECLWCGQHSQKLRRWVEQVERSAWEPVTDAKPPAVQR
jgi:Zn ribbon nucleic-acid-binding protein